MFELGIYSRTCLSLTDTSLSSSVTSMASLTATDHFTLAHWCAIGLAPILVSGATFACLYSLYCYVFSFFAYCIPLEYSTRPPDGATEVPTSYRTSSTMAGQTLGAIEAVTAMASKNTYSLDDLVSYAMRRSSELFKNKEEVLSLFNDAHFEERNIRINEGTGDTIQDKVLRVGNWGRYGEEELWAGRIDGKVIYCRGTSGETLSIPPGASSNPFKFGYRQHYYKNDRKLFCFVDPKKIPQSGDPTKFSSRSEHMARTGEFLDLLVEILFLRHQLIDETPDNKGGFLNSWFKNVCMLLHNGDNYTPTTRRDKSLADDSGFSRKQHADLRTYRANIFISSLKRPRLAVSFA
jgi:hypothetical protein